MQEWEYKELREYVSEVFQNSLNDGLNALQAGGRCLYELSNVLEEGDTERVIFYLSLADLQIRQGILSQRIYEEVQRMIVEFSPEKFVDELCSEDVGDLNLLVQRLVERIETVELSG